MIVKMTRDRRTRRMLKREGVDAAKAGYVKTTLSGGLESRVLQVTS